MFTLLLAVMLNALCPGTCQEGGACGGHADCASAVCTFPDACLPGAAHVIGAVAPEQIDRLNDWASWDFNYSTVTVAGGAARIHGRGITDSVTHTISLLPGRRYLLRAWLSADAGTYGYFDIAGDVIGAESQQIIGPAPFTAVNATFVVPLQRDRPVVRIHAHGPGSIGVRDFVLYRLDDYRVYVRFAVERSGTLTNRIIQRHGVDKNDPKGFTPGPCGDLLLPNCIDPKLINSVAPAEGFGPWLDASGWLGGTERATYAFDVTDAAGKFLEGAQVRVQVAWAPDPARVFFDRSRKLAGHTIGLVLPEGVPPPDRMAADTGFLSDLILTDLGAIDAPVTPPRRLWTGTILNSIDWFDEYSTVAGTLDLFHDAGMNRRSYLGPPREVDRAHAAALGMDKDLLHAEGFVPGGSADFDLRALGAYSDSAAMTIDLSATSGFRTHPQDLFVILGDEVGGQWFKGPRYTEAFRAWSQLPDGQPLENFDSLKVLRQRPNPLLQPEAARRWLLALRFWNEASAQTYRQARLSVEARTGVAAPASVNFGTPFANYFTYNEGVEFQTMARAGAATALLGEGFLFYADTCLAAELGVYADYAAGQVRHWGLPLASYLHGNRGDMRQKTLALAARGFHYFNYYAYGPYDLSTGDGVGGLGEASRGWLRRVAAGDDALAHAEDALEGARRAPAQIALLAPQSDPVWTDASALTRDEVGLHVMLTHAGFPLDYIVEEHLAAELPGRRMLVVDREILSNAAFAAVQEFVEGGGVLLLGPGRMARDELGQPAPARAAWLKLPEVRRGMFADVSIGQGSVRVFGGTPGEDYLTPEALCETAPGDMGLFPEGWSANARSLVAGAAARAGAVAPATSSNPVVEVQRLDRPDGSGAVILLARANAGVTIDLAIAGVTGPIRSALTGAVASFPYRVAVDRIDVWSWPAQ